MAGELHTPLDSDDLIRPTSSFSEMFPNEINPEYQGVSLMDEVFSRDKHGNLNPQLVGSFFKEAVEIDQSDTVPQTIKDTLRSMITPALLEAVANESTQKRWDADSVEHTLHAYTRFQTIESKFEPEEAREIYRTIARELVYGRAVDEALERVGEITTSEGRGVTIYLGTRGAEMAQTVAKIAYRNTSEEEDAQTIIDTYYRDHLLGLNPLGKDNDPDADLITIEESIADLARVEGSARSKGVELNVKGKINNHGDISLFPSTPNVGGHIIAGTGFAARKRLEAVRQAGLTYDEPKRADAFRDLQLDTVGSSVLISLGDGAYPEMLNALEFQSALRLPVINFVQNNEVAIGVENSEVVAVGEYWKKGHGIGIPGVRINTTDMDALYLAMEFATRRAVYDAGPTIIEAKTVRLLPHSSQHGDHLTSQYIQEVEQVLNEFTAHIPEHDLRREHIQHIFNREIVKPAQTDNQLKLKERLSTLGERNLLDKDLIVKILQIKDQIIDPAEVVSQDLLKRDYVTQDELETWKTQAKGDVEKKQEEVLSRPRPLPTDALDNLRLETPAISHIREVSHSPERVRMNGAEAVQRALMEAMQENPNVLAWGTDVFKGLSIDRGTGGSLRYTWQGGYFTQENGLFPAFGHEPMRVMNTPIAESAIAKLALGFATTPTNEKALQDAFRLFVDFQYADYGIQAWEAWHILGDILWSTSGQMTRPVTVFLPSGAVAGGGPRHGDEVAHIAYSTNTNVDVLYGSDPETIYKLLKYNLLHNDNPTIFMADKKSFLGDSNRREFEVGTGLMEPGKARLIHEGSGDLQIISYGPMVNTIRTALNHIDDPHIKERVSVLDLVSLRPFPTEDVMEFLKSGNRMGGNILIAHEEPKSQGFGNQIHSFLTEADSDFWRYTRRRKFYKEAGKDTPGIPTDGPQMDLVIPTAERIKERIIGLTGRT